jgi:zinc transport system ATP-binding protein
VHVSNPLVLDVRDLCVNLAGHRVLDHVSLQVQPGEFVGITGPNGGGKSTLLRAILGLVPSCCGSTRFRGLDLRTYQRGHSIGYVPQNAAHIDSSFPATAREVVAMGQLAGRRRRFAKPGKVEDAMRATGVAELAGRRIGEMSGGQRQRVLLAKALVGDPQLLILDEPTTGIDAASRDAFAHLLSDLSHDRGITVLLVSHDADILHHACTRLLVIDRKLVSDTAPNPVASALAKLHGATP